MDPPIDRPDRPALLDRPTSSASDPTGPCALDRRKRDKLATKQALLAAGIEVFAERGYDAATTREVAARAQVNEQLISRYFGGKSGLLVAILQGFGQSERACLGRMPPRCGDLAGELNAFLAAQIVHTRQAQCFIKVALTRAIVDPEVAAEMARQVAQGRVPFLLEWLITEQACGRIRSDVDPAALAAGLSSLGFGLGVLDQLVFDTPPDQLDAMATALARVIADGLRSSPVATQEHHDLA
jgi:AcrR family transcriptional regulator